MLRKNIHFFISLIMISSGAYLSVFAKATAAEASARHYTEKPFILEGERQPFYIELSNPTSADFRVVRVTVSFSANVDVRGLDSSCSKWLPSGLTEVICIIPQFKAGSVRQLSYDVVGDTDLRPRFEASVVISSLDGSIPVRSQESESVGLSDNSRFIEGAKLEISVARDILKDSDADGISDVSERILATDPSRPNSVSRQNAVIDVAILFSEDTDDYYNGKFGGRAEYLIAATNQFYRDNGVGITLRLVAMGSVDYSGTSIDQASTDFTGGENSAFSNLDSIIDGTGADVLVFAHPMFRSGDSACGIGLTNAEAVQGDFYRELYRDRMLSVIDVSRNCGALSNLAGLLAFNMGVVTNRIESPDGGTFSFSSGYVQDESFATREAGQLGQFSSELVRLNKLSSPERLCLGQPCGIDRNNLSQGADSVFSLNATRHIVADLSPTVMPVSEEVSEPKITIDEQNLSALEVVQYPSATRAMVGDWVSYQVEARNTSSTVLHNLEFRFNDSAVGELLRTNDGQCAILAAKDEEVTMGLANTFEGRGEIVCYVRTLNPGQAAGFNYSAQIENTISLLGDIAYLKTAFVNNFFKPESQACTAVTENLTDAFDVTTCELLKGFADDIAILQNPLNRIDLTLSPVINESILTVPFIRLFDGGLISAQFKIIQGAARVFRLTDMGFLEPRLNPMTVSEFSSDEMLTIPNFTIDGQQSTLVLKYVEGSVPPLFIEQI